VKDLSQSAHRTFSSKMSQISEIKHALTLESKQAKILSKKAK
jgi:hypothetical protein